MRNKKSDGDWRYAGWKPLGIVGEEGAIRWLFWWNRGSKKIRFCQLISNYEFVEPDLFADNPKKAKIVARQYYQAGNLV